MYARMRQIFASARRVFRDIHGDAGTQQRQRQHSLTRNEQLLNQIGGKVNEKRFKKNLATHEIRRRQTKIKEQEGQNRLPRM